MTRTYTLSPIEQQRKAEDEEDNELEELLYNVVFVSSKSKNSKRHSSTVNALSGQKISLSHLRKTTHRQHG